MARQLYLFSLLPLVVASVINYYLFPGLSHIVTLSIIALVVVIVMACVRFLLSVLFDISQLLMSELDHTTVVVLLVVFFFYNSSKIYIIIINNYH